MEAKYSTKENLNTLARRRILLKRKIFKANNILANAQEKHIVDIQAIMENIDRTKLSQKEIKNIILMKLKSDIDTTVNNILKKSRSSIRRYPNHPVL